MSMVFFSSLPSTSFLQKNPNPNPNSSFSFAFSSPLHFKLYPSPITINLSRKPSCVAAVRSTSPAVTEASETRLDISKLGISDEIVSALSRRGITELFPIQRAVLEPAMGGRDMIGRAITGSGKTLAFGIPIMDKIIRHQSQNRQRRAPSALVLAPTRELARQVQKEFKDSAPNLSSACLYGGVPIMSQSRMLRFGIDIAVGTPGRIIDLVQRGALNLSEVKFVVLDEADQMLAIGFQEDVECILNYLPPRRQCMLFSATMPSWVNELSRKYLKNPLVIDLVGNSDQKLADGISLYSVESTASEKPKILSSLISQFAQSGKCIVFTKTKKDAEVLSRSMGSILGSRALHGNMQQMQRDKTLAAFRDGRFNVLVATDVAARGLDIPNVDLVIHFEIPNTPEIFVHRSGRTGRAGKEGTAILIFTESQRRAVRFIERDLSCKFKELPAIASRGNMTDTTDFEEAHYGRYSDSMEDTYGRYNESMKDTFRHPTQYGAGRSGNYGGNRGWDRGSASDRSRHSYASKQKKGRFGTRESFSSIYSEKTRNRNTHVGKSIRDNEQSAGRKGTSNGRRLRSLPKFQFDELEPFALNSNFDDEEYLSKKKHSNNPESGIDFKDILNALRDHK